MPKTGHRTAAAAPTPNYAIAQQLPTPIAHPNSAATTENKIITGRLKNQGLTGPNVTGLSP
jgi:hypothetical protein